MLFYSSSSTISFAIIISSAKMYLKFNLLIHFCFEIILRKSVSVFRREQLMIIDLNIFEKVKNKSGLSFYFVYFVLRLLISKNVLFFVSFASKNEKRKFL
jgi:hypothetical protein